jgi:hypothetical protein
LTRGVGISKIFTLKFIIQGLLQLYMKAKVLFMASIGKDAFNIDGLTIYSTLHILVQQSLSSLPNLLTYSLNRLTCQYEQL